jgi:DNA mismatch endonuclease, patch repair protein
MSRIKGKDTSIELLLRSALYQEGYRYRKNDPRLPGHPDIVLSKYRIVIFVDGDFFHGYDLRKTEASLKRHKAYWEKKIITNRQRDRKNDVLLTQKGYMVLHFWEHEIRRNLPGVVAEIQDVIAEKTLTPVSLKTSDR